MTENPYIAAACDLQGLVRTHAADNEAQRRLDPLVAQAFARSGLYRIAAPEDCYGSEQDPFTQIGAIEAIAYADGSAGWNLMIGIESFGLVAPGFGDSLHLIEDPTTVLCSSTAAVGRADRVEGGYRVSGRWQFVSGCHNAQIFGATVRIWENGERVETIPNRYAVMLADEWQILDTWHTGGMCGSGSHDVVVEDVFVPEDRLVAPIGGADHDSPLLRFPLGARLAYNKVGVAWGLARAGLDAFVELAEGKQPRFSSRGLRERPRAQRALAEAEVRFRAGKALVLELLGKMWVQVQGREHITSRERALFQLACSDSVRGCIEAVNTVVEAAGTTANQREHPLERIARDIKVVGQHITVAPHHIEDAGRMLLGLPAQEMMLGGVASLQTPAQGR
ncbi:MAG: acyl-CoA dehydrogenase family protein [Pseudomonadota bacterium]